MPSARVRRPGRRADDAASTSWRRTALRSSRLIGGARRRSDAAPAIDRERAGRSKRPPRPLAAQRRQVSAVPAADAAQRPAGGGGAASRAAGRQHADDRARRQRARSQGQARPRPAGRGAARPRAPTEQSRRTQMNDEIDFLGGAHGRRRRNRSELPQHGRDEGQLRDRPADAVGHGPPSGVRRRKRSSGSASRCCPGCRSASTIPEFIANAVFDRLVYGFHPYGMPQTGTPTTLAAITRDDLAAFHRRTFVPNNTILAMVGDVTAEEAFDGVEKVFGDWERREVPTDDVHRAARADPPRRDRRQQARRGADRGARRSSRRQAQPSRLHGAQPGHPHPGRRGRQSTAPGAADRTRADLRRPGRDGHPARERRLRGVDQHAIRGHRRGAAADGGRVLAAAARAGARTRARRTPRPTSRAASRSRSRRPMPSPRRC